MDPANAQQGLARGDVALAALTKDPAEQLAARELLREKLGPIGALIGVPMVRTVHQPALTQLTIAQTATGYRVTMSSSDSVEGDRAHMWIDLDPDLNPLTATSYLRPMNFTPMQFAQKTNTSISFIDRYSGSNFMVTFSVNPKDVIVWENGYLRKNRFAGLGKPWSWRSTYAVKDRAAILAQIDAYAAKSAREADREASREAFGSSLFGAMVGGWTSSNQTEGMLAGARAGAEGPEALQRMLADNAAIARAEAAGSETRFQESLLRLRMQQNSQPSGQSEAAHVSGTSSGTPSGSAVAPTRPPVERRPLRLFMSVVPAVGEKDKTQPVCVSNVLDLGEVANWPDVNGAYQDSVAYDAARPLFETFVSLCRNERGDMRTVSPATVQIINNGYAGIDLEAERRKVINAHTPNAYWLVTM